jgi:hypothetical protein
MASRRAISSTGASTVTYSRSHDIGARISGASGNDFARMARELQAMLGRRERPYRL